VEKPKAKIKPGERIINQNGGMLSYATCCLALKISTDKES